MKKINRVLAVALSFCAFLPFVNAQTGGSSVVKSGEWQEKEGFKYRKSVSEPTTQGIYTITLESFTTGELKLEAAPCDVVLVLDMSGSMRWAMGDVSSGSSDARKHAMQDAVKAFIEAIDDNDRYLPDDDDPNTPRVKRQHRLGNKIGMIKFADNASPVIQLTGLGGNTESTALDVDNVTGKNALIYAINNIGTPSGSTYANKGMNMAYDWLTASSLGADRKIRTCILFTDGAPGSDNYWTSSNVGSRNGTWNTANAVIAKANEIKNIGNEANKIISRVYTVSIFAGSTNRDYIDVYLGKTSSNYKGATNMGTYETWNSTNIWGNGNGTQVAGLVPENKGPQNFAFATIDAAELKNIFEKIADESGGSAAQLGSSTVSQVDVISASFKLPDGYTKNDIHVFTARYQGDDATGMATFGQEIEAPGREDTYTKITKKIVDGHEIEEIQHGVDVDAAITWDISNSEGSTDPDAKMDRISVSGFDYANLWCGPDESVVDGEYAGKHQGYKLIVKIPIKMDEGAVGGPTLNTNAPGSGFIVNGQMWAEFNPPQVSLPVNVHIQKRGLDVGESAKFTIQRRVAGSTGEWLYVTSVFVTRTSEADAEPIVKVVGLPATDNSTPAKPYVYRVVEDKWNWAYKLTSIQDSEGHEIGDKQTRSATSDDLEVNPFIFVNTKKTNIDGRVKNAESKAMNVFLPGRTEGEYIDSKQR